MKGVVMAKLELMNITKKYITEKKELLAVDNVSLSVEENEFISIGGLVHEEYYRKFKKELLVDNKIKIDILEGKKVIGEIKKSSKYLESAKMQLAFYLYYLKTVKGERLEGELLIPEERKRIRVKLTTELEKEIERAVWEIEQIVNSLTPPPATKTRYCKNCAYREFCWS